ncbi:MAG: hypothetical protein IH861_06440 [Chloroflexi bacterium]|nr:hypothetical protein [Chloroflexota bacterium]
MFPLGIFAHQGEPGDPILLEWIRHQIDAIFNLGPGAIVLGLGAFVVVLPIIIIFVFLFAQRGGQSRT